MLNAVVSLKLESRMMGNYQVRFGKRVNKFRKNFLFNLFHSNLDDHLNIENDALFLPEGTPDLNDLPLPEDILELIEKIRKSGGSLEDIMKLIKLLRILGLIELIKEILKLLSEGIAWSTLLLTILSSLALLLAFLTSMLQRINRFIINLVFVHIITGTFTEDGSPIYRVGLIDTYDPNMILLRSILQSIPNHGFRFTLITNNQGGYITALETNIEIAGDPNSRFSGASQ